MNNQGRMLVGWVYDPHHADLMAEQAESARVEVRLQRHPPIAAGRPVLSESRAWELQFNWPVHLESNVWIGVGSQIMSSLTVGVPSGVVREIRDHTTTTGSTGDTAAATSKRRSSCLVVHLAARTSLVWKRSQALLSFARMRTEQFMAPWRLFALRWLPHGGSARLGNRWHSQARVG